MAGKNDRLITVLLVIVFILTVASIAFIYSSSFTVSMRLYGQGSYFVIKQSIWYILGFVLMLLFSFINYKKYKNVKGIIFLLGIFILILVLFIGKEVKGAKRWISIGKFTIQPSEFAKILFLIYFSGLLEKLKKEDKKDLDIIIPAFIAIMIYVFLIFFEKDFSSALHLLIVGFIMVLVTDVKKRYLGSLTFLGVSLGFIGIMRSKNRIYRVILFFDGIKKGVPTSHQVKQSLIGIGNGGFWGLGFGNGLQKYYYLPEPHTDFIFSLISEETGFIGGLCLIILYIVIFIIGIMVINKTKDYFGKYLALGIVSLITVQVLMNLFVVTNLIPPTGIPLAFISSGGSSILSLLISLGILINIVKKGEEK